ncbi:MAG: guanylate kinase [Gammaproteobacteria bacterium]|nr:guanylate kinase [Gammaproteobacteria bacterium]MDE2345354.1 guanylate kinase [Gammaproteobacteria bacterium]
MNSDSRQRGRLILIAAPSGAGKTSLVRALLERHPRIRFSISYTTRPQRPNEARGHDYHFVSQLEFDRMVADGEFLEHARVFDYCYGTERKSVESELQQGHDLLLEIDWQGAQQVRKAMPEAVSIFILPPSLDELRRRLQKRAAEERSRLSGPGHAATEIERRLREAVTDISHWREFDYVIVNDAFERSLHALGEVLAGRGQASRASRGELPPLVDSLLA